MAIVESADRLEFKDCSFASQQIGKQDLPEVTMADFDRHFEGGTASLGNLLLIDFFIEVRSKLRVDLEDMAHDVVDDFSKFILRKASSWTVNGDRHSSDPELKNFPVRNLPV